MTWKGFEQIVERIHRQWSPTAEVRHNHKIRGHSGRMRQLDVTVSAQIGPYRIFIVVECKDKSRPVSIEQVEAFAKKLEDVGASQGVIVSKSGFDDGAKAIALQNNIRLLNYREAEVADWKQMLGDNAQWFFTVTEVHPEETEVDVADDGQLDDDDLILSPSGQVIGTVDALREMVLKKTIFHARLLGNFELRLNMDGFVLQSSAGSQEFRAMTIRGRKVARRFYVSTDTPAGHIIEDALNGDVPFAELEQVIPWEEIAESHPGREISIQEYLARHTPTETIPMKVDWSDSNGQLRITLRRDSSVQ
jgi:DNA-binding transcriptional regulator YdaS (Cro superfamily)